MSISIKGQTGWASIPNSIGRSRLPYPTLSLMINLLTHSEGFSASYALIQDQTGMATATISTAIRNLEKLGLLTVKKMPRTGGKYASNHYTFHADNIWKLTPEFVDQRLGREKTASKNEAGKKSPTSGNEGGTASLNEVAPLQEMKAKNDQGELPVENDQPPLTPQGGNTGNTGDQIEIIDAVPVVEKPAGKKRGTDGHQLPEGWMPAPRSIQIVRDEHPGITEETLIREHRKFSDHWAAATGQRARKKDWDATWRNWMRTAMERTQPRGSNSGKPTMQEINTWTLPIQDPNNPTQEPDSDYRPF